MCNATHDRRHADTTLEQYVTVTVMNVITTFFDSPFSDQSTTVQVHQIVGNWDGKRDGNWDGNCDEN